MRKVPLTTGLTLPPIFNSHLKALVSASPTISAGICPTQVRLIEKKSTDRTGFDLGFMRRSFFYLFSLVQPLLWIGLGLSSRRLFLAIARLRSRLKTRVLLSALTPSRWDRGRLAREKRRTPRSLDRLAKLAMRLSSSRQMS